jgi:hypothetical protein
MKKNLLKVPRHVLDRINTFELDDIVVACAKRLTAADLSKYAHLGLAINDGRLSLPSPFIPDPRAGRYSSANVEGREIVRRDLPMVKKSFSWETPNWGDWSKGSHTHVQTREVYERDFIPPKEVELSVTLLDSPSEDKFFLKFAVEQVLRKNTPDFEAELLYNLNILQENVGAVDVFESAASLEDYLATVRVDWEILPPGSVDEVVRRMLEGKRSVTEEQRKTMEARLRVMAGLKPAAYIAGTNGFLRYFGAKFEEDFVAFENVAYGNALYVMYEQWEELSKRSRIDLLKGSREGFERIEHREGWEERLKALLRERRKK